MGRRPVVAGSFYPGTTGRLRDEIHHCFMHPNGPGEIPKLGTGAHRKIKGVIAPHAGYIFSGHVAAHAYAEVAREGFPDTFVFLGPNHTGMGSGVSIMTQGSWETPLGQASINENLAKKIWKGIIDADDDAHQYEHSIEVQLPFLQYFNPVSFVPIAMAMQDYDTAREVGDIIASSASTKEEDILVIASTDFSHVGIHYMQVAPPRTAINEWTMQQDQKAIKKILDLDEKGLMETVTKNDITMCGYGCVTAMLTAVKKMGATKAQLLKYATSYDTQPGDSCVGYGAFIIQ